MTSGEANRVTRRSFIGWFTLLLGAIPAIGATAVGAVSIVGSVFRRAANGAQRFARVGVVREFKMGSYRRVELCGGGADAWRRDAARVEGAAYVRLESGGSFTAFSTRCPHLGCEVAIDDAGRAFRCPCHGSEFDASGKRKRDSAGKIIGPAPRDLDPLAVRIASTGEASQNGSPPQQVVEVEVATFQTGTSSRKRI
ncbi:MAG: Rieske 2Fe-2S domain-containing protein [Deltaproteobacteria bacterium]|nr:Rieske 2Fe-2S domain-containing protein [Deltaproteobacteria bacterium]